jgi:hypothetical protein
MEQLLKPMELLIQIANQTSQILERLEQIENKKLNSNISDFNIDTFAKASKN